MENIEKKNKNSQNNVHKNHRQRVRAEMRNIQYNTLDDYRLLEYLLFNVHSRKDTNPIAHNLINTFGNFANVLEASYNQLIQVKDVGERTATYIKGIIPMFERYTSQKATAKEKVTTTQDYVKHYGEIIKYSQVENLAIIALNNRYEACKFIKLEVGENDNVEVKFNNVYNALKDSEYKKAIIMHNHPSGNPKPSPEDFSTTSTIKLRMKILGIDIVDSIIVSTNGFYSFKDSGVLDSMDKNIEHVLNQNQNPFV